MKKLTYAMVALALVSGPAFGQDSSTTTTTQQQTYDTPMTTTTTQETSATKNPHYSTDGNRAVQFGADYAVPYRVDSPSGRTTQLIGAHAEMFFVPAWALSLEGLFGIEDKNGFADKPIYITPGFSFYGAPGRVLEPYFKAVAPILINNGQDLGVGGGLGFLWNTGLSGLGLRYSFDATYYFDQKVTSLNLANVSAVFSW